MKSRLALAAVLVWFAVVFIAFAYHQFSGFEKASLLAAYAGAALKVLAAAGAATALGLRVLRRREPRFGDVVVGLAVGLAVLGIGTFALASAKLLRPYVLWPGLGVILVLARRQAAALLTWLRHPDLPRLDAGEAALAALLGCGSLLMLVGCLAPLAANDALVYHLNLPKTYAAASGLVRMPYNVYANMPHYGEILYTLFFALAGETGAKMAYLMIVMGAGSAVFVLARRFAPRKLAMAGAACFLVEPLVLDGRIVCNVDMLLAYFYISAIVLLFEGAAEGYRLRSVWPAALIAGFMLGVKYTAIFPCLSLVAVPLMGSGRRNAAKRLLAGALIALAVFAPWPVKNQAYVGSPFYPMFESTFDGANWDRSQETALVGWQRGMGMGREPAKYLALPFNVSTRGKPALSYMFFDGTMTPLILILFPLALLRRSREILTLAGMTAALFACWALTSQQLRFLLPAIALGAAAGAAGLANLAGRAGPRAASLVVGCAVIAIAFSLLVPDQYGRPFVAGTMAERLPVDLGLESRQQYLERTVQSYSMFDYIRKSLPAKEPVLLVWENRTYYLDNPHFADSFFEASTLMRMVAASRDGKDLAGAIRRLGFRYVVTNDMLGEVFSRYYPPSEVAKLKDLVRSQLEPVHSANKMTLYALRP